MRKRSSFDWTMYWYGDLQNSVSRSLLQPDVTTPLPDHYKARALEGLNDPVEG